MAQPRLPDIETLRAQGFMKNLPCELKDAIVTNLRIVDEQNAIGSFDWFNLPSGLDGELIERMLYYRGQVAFFYVEELDKFFCLPFTFTKDIDCYGRYKCITPLCFTGKSEVSEDEKKKQIWMPGLSKKVLWDMPEEIDYSTLRDYAIILTDYSKQLPQRVVPMQARTESIIQIEAEMIPYMRTALMNSVGVSGVRVRSQDEAPQVDLASSQVQNAALNGRKWIALTSSVETQDIGNDTPARAEEFLLSMQAIDNFRLSLHGLSNGGLFQKKEHELQSQADMNGGQTGIVLNNRLYQRQKFCDLVNIVTGLGIACMPSENATGSDNNMDGLVSDEQDQSGTQEGEQPNV